MRRVDLKATKRYVDKFSKQIIEEGTVLKNVGENRAKELIAEGVAEEAKESKKSEPKQEG